MRRKRDPIETITDVEPSPDEQLRRRKRTYTILMAVHIIGFGVGGSLYEVARTTGLILIVGTAALPWMAVILANSLPRRPRRQRTPVPTLPRSARYPPT